MERKTPVVILMNQAKLKGRDHSKVTKKSLFSRLNPLQIQDGEAKSGSSSMDGGLSEIKSRSTVKRFKQLKTECFLPFECPSCKNHFGLNAQKVECMEVNMHFTCPYCGKNHGIKD